MLRLVPLNTKINFVKISVYGSIASIILIIASLFFIFSKGLNWGIDFSGGTLVEIQTPVDLTVNDVRKAATFEGSPAYTVQAFGSTKDFVIRFKTLDNVEQQKVVSKLKSNVESQIDAKIMRVEFVGSVVGDELRSTSLVAVIISLAAILLYLSFRFEFRFAFGAVAALFHDVIITIGCFAFLQKDVSLATLAALLTVIGYSLNDTIVVFDRIKENHYKDKAEPLPKSVNLSLNQVMNRTLMTSFTTLVVLICLYFLGGEVLNGFALVLIIGVFLGTSSSICIATAIVVYLEKWLPTKTDDEKLDVENYYNFDPDKA